MACRWLAFKIGICGLLSSGDTFRINNGKKIDKEKRFAGTASRTLLGDKIVKLDLRTQGLCFSKKMCRI